MSPIPKAKGVKSKIRPVKRKLQAGDKPTYSGIPTPTRNVSRPRGRKKPELPASQELRMIGGSTNSSARMTLRSHAQLQECVQAAAAEPAANQPRSASPLSPSSGSRLETAVAPLVPNTPATTACSLEQFRTQLLARLDLMKHQLLIISAKVDQLLSMVSRRTITTRLELFTIDTHHHSASPVPPESASPIEPTALVCEHVQAVVFAQFELMDNELRIISPKLDQILSNGVDGSRAQVLKVSSLRETVRKVARECMRMYPVIESIEASVPPWITLNDI